MKKIIIASIAVIVCIVCGCYWYSNCVVNRNFSRVVPQTEGDLKIGSINVCGLSYGGKREITEAVLLKAAKDNGLDVLVIEEFPKYPEGSDVAFAGLFSSYFPYISIKDECAVLSKTPVWEHERKPFLGCAGSYSSILVGPEEFPVRIIGVHLRTTGMSVVNSGRGVDGTDDLARMRQMMRANRQIRIQQAKSVRKALFKTSEPVIIAGDFNSLPGSRVYRILKGDDLSDSFMVAGKGKGSTYRLLKDKIRIDYFLYSDDLDCVGSQILDDKISDHRLIVSTFNRK